MTDSESQKSFYDHKVERQPSKLLALYPRTPVVMVVLCLLALIGSRAGAQVNVLTGHNDIARTGRNLTETVLTPNSVSNDSFGKLFSWKVNGSVFAQPLYVSKVNIPGKGVHNIAYVVTNQDYVYAFDADSNGGVNANPLWQVSLLTNTTPAGTYRARYGVFETPVIDLASKTLYLVSSDAQGSTYLFRLHALDITTGAEKFGGPVPIQATIAGTGTGSSGGTLKFDPTYHLPRSGLLLLNGVVYAAFGSIGDNGPWHGWIFSYNANTLQKIDVLCTSVNGSGAGIWMGAAALAAEVDDPSKPFGRMFLATGNGSFDAAPPYTRTMSYGMSVMDIDLTGGKMTVKDEFTPYDHEVLDGQDGDLGSGGPILLPLQRLASGKLLNPLFQIGKSGMMYVLDRSNLGGFNASGDKVQQEVQTPQTSSKNWGAGVWGLPAYWNGAIYFGGTNPGASNPLIAYSFTKGVLSSTPTSKTSELFSYPGPTPAVSANGNANGIVWAVNSSAYNLGPSVLLAFSASNLSRLLYSSNANLARDNPGGALEYVVPTIANGKVYVGAAGQFTVYGLLASTPTVATPVISPAGSVFTGSQVVTLTDSTAGAAIYYTTDGTAPTVASKLYSGPFTLTSNATVTAIASATGYLQGKPVSAQFSSTANAANPTFSLAAGTYSGAQKLTISDSSAAAKIYYTTDGSTPTTSSKLYTGPVTVDVSETFRAFATAPGLLPSSIVAISYVIEPAYTLDFRAGFADAESSGKIQFNGSTGLDDFRLQLTDGGKNEAGSAFYTQKVNAQYFTTDFTFQLSNPVGDGITFTIQNDGLGALGPAAGGLGYQKIKKSVAIKFDILSNYGEGGNSTGLYTNGALPAMPSIDLTGTGIDLHSGDYISAHVTYDGKNLTLTLTDAVTLASWSHAWPIDIPAVVGGPTAWVGFTGSTGQSSASQKLTSWTYLNGKPTLPNYPVGFSSAGLYMNGTPTITGGALQLTTASAAAQTNSAYYSLPVQIESFTSDFDFRITKKANSVLGEGLTFVIQNDDPHAIGSGGGGLGYATITNSVAIKFDLFDDAGEGDNSTGVFVNGAKPTVPSLNLTLSGFSIGSGDLIRIHITYDGTTLAWTVRDLTHAHKTAKQTTINIPHVIGSNTAYVGFTGATSDATTATQNILDWTFANQ